MAAINNIEIFGSVCRETNPAAINIKRGKDKQAEIMTFTPPVRNVSIRDIKLVLQGLFLYIPNQRFQYCLSPPFLLQVGNTN
jgi:hypothetical protein